MAPTFEEQLQANRLSVAQGLKDGCITFRQVARAWYEVGMFNYMASEQEIKAYFAKYGITL